MTSAQRASDVGALAGRRIVLGVTGGIAAYKAVEVASRLKKAGADVRVIMTRAATSFVTPLTFREITGQPVAETMWGEPHHHVEHIALAEFAELFLVAPATANFIAKAAAGIADDMLTTSILATRATRYIAPAMNTGMWENPVTQENVARLASRGVHIIPPGVGQLACGATGAGRLPEPAEIVAIVERHFSNEQSLAGRRILVTAAGTEEALDPVRFLAQRGAWALRWLPRRHGAGHRSCSLRDRPRSSHLWAGGAWMCGAHAICTRQYLQSMTVWMRSSRRRRSQTIVPQRSPRTRSRSPMGN
mgnify:CR=1 FL=1